MRALGLMLALALAPACHQHRAAPPQNLDPYKNVLPSTVKQKVDKIQQQHEEDIARKLKDVQ